ncbi:MAG: CocE/NonD family hydrolase [Polyangiaceae bacterium]
MANAPGRSGTYTEMYATFASSIDPALTNLTSIITYDLGCAAAAGPLPILVDMHGYSQTMGYISTAVLRAGADHGFACLSVNMRGRAGDSGLADDSCRELEDVWDAIRDAVTRYPGAYDPTRVFFFGYSGGGGNALAMHSKYPGRAIAIVSLFFGGDYGVSAIPGHSYWASGDNPTEVVTRIGSRTDLQPYRARHTNTNVGQAVTQTSTKLFLAWDSEDIIGIPMRDTKRALVAADAPRSRWWSNESNPLSDNRWIHGYIEGSPDLALLKNAVFHLRDLPAGRSLVTTGTYKVLGHCNHAAGFEVWTADTGIAGPKMNATGGRRHVVDVTFNVPARSFTVSRCPQSGYTGDCAVQIRMGATVVTQDVTADGTVFNLP